VIFFLACARVGTVRRADACRCSNELELGTGREDPHQYVDLWTRRTRTAPATDETSAASDFLRNHDLTTQ